MTMLSFVKDASKLVRRPLTVLERLGVHQTLGSLTGDYSGFFPLDKVSYATYITDDACLDEYHNFIWLDASDWDEPNTLSEHETMDLLGMNEVLHLETIYAIVDDDEHLYIECYSEDSYKDGEYETFTLRVHLDTLD